jgi:hypothetical protein
LSDPITAPTVAQHVALIAEHGLIEAKVPSVEGGSFAIGPLTWHGHDFLEAARNDSLWKHVMSLIKERAWPSPFPWSAGS